MGKIRMSGWVVLIAALVVEGGVRLLGLADVPIRSANTTTGYIPVPSQSGRFLLNDWTINALSMISSEEYHDLGNEVIVAGDSIVFGGNPISQKERVGEQLDELFPQPVYAIADGSWGFKNELNYFQTTDRIRRPHAIVFVLNSRDFSVPSGWQCASTHPLAKPRLHSYFAYRKYFDLDCEVQTPQALLVDDFDANAALSALVDRMPATAFGIFLYQDKQEWAEQQSLRTLVNGYDQVKNGKVEVAELLDVPGAGRWNDAYYADGIHPSVEGAAALARGLYWFLSEMDSRTESNAE